MSKVYRDLVEYALGGLLKCIGCNKYHLVFDDMTMYDHDDGIVVPGKDVKQWVYFTCPKCQYQNAWWKLLRKVGDN